MVTWTLDELTRRVAQALTADEVRARNGRIRDLPDARAIRWYATIGLVDRPSGYRGRTALYGARHLLQILAVKHRQAQGRTLAEIQAELTGATDATLRRIVPVLPDDPGPSEQPAPPAQSRRARPAPDQQPPAHTAARRFWAAPPATPTATGTATLAAIAPAAQARYLVRLRDGATLVLTRPPDPTDLAAIEAAAGPLLRLLADRGLITLEGAFDDHRTDHLHP